MGKIYVIGLGPGNIDDLTKKAIDRIESGDRNYLRTVHHPTVAYLDEKAIDYESFDHIYDEMENFDQVYDTIVQSLAKLAEEGDVNYLVPGHPLVAERSVKKLLEEDLDIEIVAGLSFLEPVFELVGRDPVDGFLLLDGIDLKHWDLDINKDIIITQVHNSFILSDIKLELAEVYGDYHQVYFIQNAGLKNKEVCIKEEIYNLDRNNEPNLLTALYIPRKEEAHSFRDLLKTMDILRGEDGCPWDRKQSHESIRGAAIEEAYELVYAIDRDDTDNMIEELGDLLLQSIFHSQIAQEEGSFNIYEVLQVLVDKLIYRHPAVFMDKNLAKADEMVYNWDVLKYEKRGIEALYEKMEDTKELPSLLRSYKIQDKAAKVGFDWDTIEGPILKLREEYEEVLEAIASENKMAMEEEIGDLLFSVVNLSRFIGVNPEIAIRKTIDKFIARFKHMEKLAKARDLQLEELDLESLDRLWVEAKVHLKGVHA